MANHGLSYSRIYRIYLNMKDRCYNANALTYKHYGLKGVKVCDEWKDDFTSFYEWSMKNNYKDDLTLDRINPKGNYNPENCRWVNQKIQQNNRTNNHRITYKGQTKTIAEWGEYYGITPNTILTRVTRGFEGDDLFKIPKPQAKEVVKEIGQRAKEIRLTMNLTPIEFSRLLEVHKTSVSSWEKGKTNPNADVLIKLIEDYGLELNDLKYEDGESINKYLEKIFEYKKRRLKNELQPGSMAESTARETSNRATESIRRCAGRDHRQR